MKFLRMLRNGEITFPIAALLVLAAVAPVQAEAPMVVVTIKPVHALVAGVMAGQGHPKLLIAGAQSPHSYSLRPSDARVLDRAQLIFRVGPELEAFLDRPLAALGTGARVVTLLDAPDLSSVPARVGFVGRRGDLDDAEPAPGTRDPHIWLDPDNARAIVAAAAVALGDTDPANRLAYQVNARRLSARIRALDKEIDGLLAEVRDRPYVTAHDAFQYFEHHYRLNGIGAVVLGPERRPGARRIATLRRAIESSGARCIFSEPQFEPAMIRTLAADLRLRRAELDPLGAGLAPGAEAWFELMRRGAAALVACLGDGG
jgi:zinc transport system substrate-binding protein